MIKSFDRILNQALPTFLKISAVIGSAVQTQVANSSLYVYSIPFMNEAYIVDRVADPDPVGSGVVKYVT